MAQIQLTIALILTALFTVAIVGFAINFAMDNDSFIDIRNDPNIYPLYSNQGNLSSFSGDSQGQYNSILETTIAPASGSAQSTAPFSVTPLSLIGTITGIINVIYVEIFGANPAFKIFFNTLLAVIVFLFGLFIYKTLRGQPD